MSDIPSLPAHTHQLLGLLNQDYTQTTTGNALPGQWLNTAPVYPSTTSIPGNVLGGLGSWQSQSSSTFTASGLDELEKKVAELEERIGSKTHIDIAKNQEERIIELETTITDLMDKLNNILLEREEEKKVRVQIEAQLAHEAQQKAASIAALGMSSSAGQYQVAFPGQQNALQVAKEAHERILHEQMIKNYSEKFQQRSALRDEGVDEKIEENVMEKIKKFINKK